MNVANTIKKLGLEQAFDYLYKDPENNLLKLMNWADKFSDGEFVSQRKAIREAIENPAHPYHSFGPYICLQSALHRMLGCRVWQ